MAKPICLDPGLLLSGKAEMIKLKPITTNSWILIADDINIGIVKKSQNGYQLLSKDNKILFNSKKEVDEFFEQDIFGSVILSTPTEKERQVEHFVKGYPINYPTPEDVAIDSMSQLPVFKKRTESDVFLCAGYYCLKSNNGWRSAFCPKLSTTQKNDYRGPFRSEMEMKQVLNKIKGIEHG